MTLLRLGNMELREFDKFLKFAKTRDDEDFKVILSGGIDIFIGKEKIAFIFQLINNVSNFLRAGDIVYEVKNPKKRNIFLDEKKGKTKKIYENLFKAFMETEDYKKIKIKKDEKQMKEKERRLKRRDKRIAKLNKKRSR